MKFILKKEIIAPIIIVLVAIILCIITEKIFNKLLKIGSKRLNESRIKTINNLIINIIRFIIAFIAIVIILEIYGIDTKSLVTSLGVVGVVVGLALQDILKDFLAGMAIIFEGQYSIGDWVQINGFTGEVLPSNLRSTKLKSLTGEIKIISNRNIVELINYSLSTNITSVDVGVSYDSDVDKVKKSLENVCIKLKEEEKVKDAIVCGVQSLDASSVVFRVSLYSVYDKKISLERLTKEYILKELKKAGIEIPFNQLVVHNGK